MGENVQDLGLGEKFLDFTPKTISKLYSIKIKIFLHCKGLF